MKEENDRLFENEVCVLEDFTLSRLTFSFGCLSPSQLNSAYVLVYIRNQYIENQ